MTWGQELLPVYRNSWVGRHQVLPPTWPPPIDGTPLSPPWGYFCHLLCTDLLPWWVPLKSPADLKVFTSPGCRKGWVLRSISRHRSSPHLVPGIATSSLSPTVGTNVFFQVRWATPASPNGNDALGSLPGPLNSVHVFLQISASIPSFPPAVQIPSAFVKSFCFQTWPFWYLFFDLYWEFSINY